MIVSWANIFFKHVIALAVKRNSVTKGGVNIFFKHNPGQFHARALCTEGEAVSFEKNKPCMHLSKVPVRCR